MTRTTRRFLLIGAVLIFVLLIPIILGYAQGYRYDFQRGEITQVGALSLKTTPKDARVFLNEEPTGKTTPAVVHGLFPHREYAVRLEREGFFPWEKRLGVEPEKITAADTIILFPTILERGQELGVTEPVLSFSFSPDQNYAFVITERQRLLLLNRGAGSQYIVTFPDRLPTRSVQHIRWSSDGKRVVFMRQLSGQELWYILDATTKELINITRLYSNNLIISSPSALPLPADFFTKHVVFLPQDNAFVSVVDETVLRINPFTRELSAIATSSSSAIATTPDSILFIQDKRTLVRKDIQDSTETVVARLLFTPTSLSLSPDRQRVAFWHNFALGVVWLSDTEQQPFYTRGETTLLTQSLEPLERVRWHASSRYLFALREDATLAAFELDGRGGTHANWEWRGVQGFDYNPSQERLWALWPDGRVSVYPEQL